MTSAVPAISLGIPVYNGVRFIRPLIESLLSDPFDDLEVIVNDNGSTDGTADVLAEMRGADPRLTINRFDTNRGVQANFNEVLLRSRASLFKWCAVGDLVLPGYLETAVSHLQRHPATTLAHCRYDFTDGTARFASGSNKKRRFQESCRRLHTGSLPFALTDACDTSATAATFLGCIGETCC
jgi:glycosyltransferase involved in cell wall biosynthesis